MTRQFQISHAMHVDAKPSMVWRHITEVDIALFKHPPYLALLGVPKPLRAEIVAEGVNGARIAYFTGGRRFTQQITEWVPPARYAFTFHADPGFRVGYLLDLSSGPFRMISGAYAIDPAEEGVRLTLTSVYELRGVRGLLLRGPVRLVLNLFQSYLLRGIKANSEHDPRLAV